LKEEFDAHEAQHVKLITSTADADIILDGFLKATTRMGLSRKQ